MRTLQNLPSSVCHSHVELGNTWAVCRSHIAKRPHLTLKTSFPPHSIGWSLALELPCACCIYPYCYGSHRSAPPAPSLFLTCRDGGLGPRLGLQLPMYRLLKPLKLLDSARSRALPFPPPTPVPCRLIPWMRVGPCCGIHTVLAPPNPTSLLFMQEESPVKPFFIASSL